jgi:hypothetical protein
MDFFHELNRRKKVDSIGRAANNTGWKVPNGHEPKLEALRPYKFNIAFENKELEGWTTEKMYDPLAVHTVPIFWGDRKAVEYFNPDAFINAYDFKNEDFGYLVYLYKFSKHSKEVWKENCLKHYNTLDKKCNLSMHMSYASALSYIISTKANKDVVEISLEKHIEHIGTSLGKLGYPIDKLELTIKLKE